MVQVSEREIQRQLVLTRNRVKRLIAESDQFYAEAEKVRIPSLQSRKKAAAKRRLDQAKSGVARMKELIKGLS